MELSSWVQAGQQPRPSWLLLVFSMNEAWRDREDPVRNISFKTRECYGMKKNTHMLDSQGYPSFIQEHDTEIRGRLENLGCGNLGIWEYGFGEVHAGMVIRLCSCLGHEWRRSVTEEKNFEVHTHACTFTHASALHVCIASIYFITSLQKNKTQEKDERLVFGHQWHFILINKFHYSTGKNKT